MTLLQDTFTDVNGTLLSAHSPSVGFGWIYKGVTSEADISGNELRYLQGSLAGYALNPSTAFATDSVASIEWRRTGAPAAGTEGAIALYARATWNIGGTLAAGYTANVRLYGTTPTATIEKSAGTLATVALSIGLLDTGTHTFSFDVKGHRLVLFIDGVEVLRAWDITHTTGQVGAAVSGNADGSGASNLRVDNYSVSDSGFAPDLDVVLAIPRLVFPRNKSLAPGVLGASGGLAPPIEGQLWPRGQKSG